ncbi:hypothetical protein CAOG_05648 [Capsaspora owczarzaki ATCC 30864]|uniref:Uncharacterized protein n=1 Tax=Capsaspora owczarzaki (strain ATCC 30864) TaxID=595528 RepID=A0A0D2X3Z5_CAPO3|nr:hypothetical protein CAOG_05648 [Capsaspora owczarzaki ATCC 30864]KJE95169.1 hypothetical protein CAOG_005648 [Capsaspora owczarzaki ATCC 30864]|eukprot:XP_004346321.2 hypothetical protein CAOG_05648 [Capsaspora owczarzaki ATCC 30864]
MPLSLVMFCASHVSDEARLDMMEQMLNSWAAQFLPVELWISVSCANDALKDKVKTLLTNRGPGLNAFIRRSPYKQFEHLQWLTSKYIERFSGRSHADAWVCFTDDDDTFAIHRTSVFGQLIRAPENDQHADDAVPFVCINGPPLNAPLPRSPEQTLLIKAQNVHGNKLVKRGSGQEYFQYCVRLSLLEYFFKHTTEVLWQYQFADLLFQRFLLRGVHIDKPDNWWPLQADEDASCEYVYWDRHALDQARNPNPNDEGWIPLMDYLRLSMASSVDFNREDYWRWLKGSYKVTWAAGKLSRDNLKLKAQLELPIVQEMIRLPSYVHWRIQDLQERGQPEKALRLQKQLDAFVAKANNTPVAFQQGERYV